LRRLLSALPVFLLLAGCGLLSAEVEIPQVQVTLLQQTFDPTPPGTPLLKQLDYDLGANISSLTDPNLSYDLRLTSLEIALSSGQLNVDFASIESLVVEVLPPPGSGLEIRPVVTYQKPAGATGPITSVLASGHANIDLGPYLRAGKLTLRTTAVGTLPDFAWSADITGGFYLKVQVDYGKYL
jgi:hypothetical protein